MSAKKKDEVILQFFEEYDMEVRINTVDTDGVKTNQLDESFVLAGLLKSPKYITILSKETHEKAVARVKAYAGWLKDGKLLILPEVPSSYYDAKEMVANATQIVAEKEAVISEKDKEIEELKKALELSNAELKTFKPKE